MKKGLSFYGCAYREEGVSESRVVNILLSVANTDEIKSYIFSKEIKIILRLFLVIAMYCQGSSSKIKSIT